jgi:hypothetical protein
MDKVTRQNAANAKESSSAFEMVIGVVGNLTQIVEGNTGAGAQTQAHQASSKSYGLNVSDHAFHQIAGRPNTAPATEAKLSAKKVMPLNDSDDRTTMTIP